MEPSETVRVGVVSLPHRWGHSATGARLAIAAAHPGLNANALVDPELLDPPSGDAVFNGIPERVKAANHKGSR